MGTANPVWDYSVVDHRGPWVPKIDSRGDYLSGLAVAGAYEFERETETMSNEECHWYDSARSALRGARWRGYFVEDDRYALSKDMADAVATSCRLEGVPVLADYPHSMQQAVRSYGRLLSNFYMVTAYNSSEIAASGDGSEEDWAKRLAQTLRIFGGWRTAITESYSGWIDPIDIVGIPTNPSEATELASSELELFSAVAHEHPDLLQSYITVADHFGVYIPHLSPIGQPTKAIWSLDVTSVNFLAMVRAQPAYLSAMSGRQFENVVAQTFRNSGFEVIQTKQSRDGGYDLRVVVPLFGKVKTAFLVECKNPSAGGPVGVDVIRGLKGVEDSVRKGSAGGIVVTSTTFTGDARKEAKASGWTITLMDRYDLLDLMETTMKVSSEIR